MSDEHLDLWKQGRVPNVAHIRSAAKHNEYNEYNVKSNKRKCTHTQHTHSVSESIAFAIPPVQTHWSTIQFMVELQKMV